MKRQLDLDELWILKEKCVTAIIMYVHHSYTPHFHFGYIL